MTCIYNLPSNYCFAANDDFIGRTSNDIELLLPRPRYTQHPYGVKAGELLTHTRSTLFEEIAEKSLQIEISKYSRGDITYQTLGMFQSRLKAKLLPYFHGLLISSIGYKQIAEFVTYLHRADIKPVTIKQYLGLLKRILSLALEQELIYKIPLFPKIKAKSVPRGSFACSEYRQILKASRELSDPTTPIHINHRVTAGGTYKVRNTVPMEMTWLIQFMVNSFVRPVDI